MTTEDSSSFFGRCIFWGLCIQYRVLGIIRRGIANVEFLVVPENFRDLARNKVAIPTPASSSSSSSARLGCYGLGRPHWRQQVTLSWLHWINLVVAQHHWCCLHPPLFTIQSVKRILQKETSRKDTPRAKNNNNNIIRVAWHAILSTLVSGGVSQSVSQSLPDELYN